ncbi:MAG: histidine phosphatase family protein [Magnetococcales bacterium]|nr:histidine phosphatase family protein [Magnetococcales bacterium]MBF0439682.1 histidine phosphatase family protein [Magnetococcales bacterium]
MIPPDYKNKPEETSITIDLLRHGAPVGGVKYRGALDDPLAPEGWEAMWATVENQGPWDRILTSPLLRCAEFAKALGQRLNVTPAIEPRLREMSFGQWEGRTSAEILATDGDHLTRFWKDPLANPPPGGDNLGDVQSRLQTVWDEILLDSNSQNILIVAHGGVIRVLLSLVLLTPLNHLSRITVPYASLARIRVDRIGEVILPRLIFCGMTSENLA